ncbi:MAG: c-type cytochrome domain-containing protein, partial [Verrucomicrobiota bacterium]
MRLFFLISGCLLIASTGVAREPLTFNRDIRPILSDRCFQCHGPDDKKREAGLRLDLEADAKRDLGDGTFAIVPGDVERSQLIQRIVAPHPDDRMPPEASGKTLSKEEIGRLKQWISEGAPFEKHWAFQKPRRPDIPTVKASDWPRNDIDLFVLAELEHRGLLPSPEADRHTLIRRLSLDLLGLPPTPDAID